MLTVVEVARQLKCSPSLIYALCADGKLRHVRLGLGRGTIRITEEQLADFLVAIEFKPASSLPEGLRHIRLPS